MCTRDPFSHARPQGGSIEYYYLPHGNVFGDLRCPNEDRVLTSMCFFNIVSIFRGLFCWLVSDNDISCVVIGFVG